MLFIKVFHEDIMLLLVFLAVWAVVIFIGLWITSIVFRSLNHYETLEILYTVFPFLCLIIIGVLSIKVLFGVEEIDSGHDLSIKITGHQWYWTYAYGEDIGGLEFDSYIIPSNLFSGSNFRLLDVDHHMVCRVDRLVRLATTSEDVLHSWAVPCLGLKIDVIPGRLNCVNIFCKIIGLFFGQCSEICGVNHAFMPICVESVPVETYKIWVMRLRHTV